MTISPCLCTHHDRNHALRTFEQAGERYVERKCMEKSCICISTTAEKWITEKEKSANDSR
jgi:hypothetical protein